MAGPICGLLLSGLLLFGGRGTDAQLTAATSTSTSTTNNNTNNLSTYLFYTILRHMVNTNENLEGLKFLFEPVGQQQQQQQPDDDLPPSPHTGPTFVSQHKAEADDDHAAGCQCACPNSNGGRQEADDDNLYGGAMFGANGGTSAAQLMSLLTV